MSFRLFTNIAMMDSQKHIYEYVSSSSEHSSPGLHHPALRCRVILIRSSPGLHHPALRSRVLRSRVLIRFRPRPSLFIRIVLLPSHPEGPVSQHMMELMLGALAWYQHYLVIWTLVGQQYYLGEVHRYYLVSCLYLYLERLVAQYSL